MNECKPLTVGPAAVAALEAQRIKMYKARAKAKKTGVWEVGTGSYCSPRHPTHVEPPLLDSNGIL